MTMACRLSKCTLPGMVLSFAMAALLALSPSGVAIAEEISSTITSNGLTVEFAARAAIQGEANDKIVAGQDVEVRFKVTDAVTGIAVSNTNPGVWIDGQKKIDVVLQKSGEAVDTCREKIGYFLQRGLTYRADIDLNAWYILALNRKASITVIDPLLGYGGQRIITLITLNSPGEDWVMGRDSRSLFVALPATDELAVVDTAIWKIATNIKVGRNPVRLVLQQDGRYLWVGRDGGVSVVDTEKRTVVQEIATGAGGHDIALGKGDREAFVSNPAQGTVSVIDVGTLKTVATVAVGGSPGAIAYSPLAEAIYVADAKSGVISVIDPAARKVAATMPAKTGTLRVAVHVRRALGVLSQSAGERSRRPRCFDQSPYQPHRRGWCSGPGLHQYKLRVRPLDRQRGDQPDRVGQSRPAGAAGRQDNSGRAKRPDCQCRPPGNSAGDRVELRSGVRCW